MTTVKLIQIRDDKAPQNLKGSLKEQITAGRIEIHDELHPNHPTTDALLTYSIEGDPFTGVLSLSAKPETVRFMDGQGNISPTLEFPIEEASAQGTRFYTLRFHFPAEGPRMSTILKTNPDEPDRVEFTVDPYPDQFEVRVSIAGAGLKAPAEEAVPIKIVYEKEAVNG